MMETVLVIARFAQFSAVMLLFGASLFRLRFSGETEDPGLTYWYRPVLASAAVVTMVSSLAWLGIEAGIMAGGWSNAADPETLATVLSGTRFGRVWQWDLASAAILLCVVFTSSSERHKTLWTAVVVGLSGFLVATSAWIGHAVAHRGLAGVIHPLVQVVHVLAAATWLGSLPVLGFALHKVRARGEPAWRNAIRDILPRYSRLGYLTVGLILLTGCLNSWFMLDSIDALFSSTYGQILVVKIALFLLMLGVAVDNRFVLTPEIVNPRSSSIESDASLRRLWRNVAIEQGLGLSIIAVVSVLGTMAPAMPGHGGM